MAIVIVNWLVPAVWGKCNVQGNVFPYVWKFQPANISILGF